MKIINDDVDLRDFKAWSGGKDRLDELISIGTVDKAQQEIEELFPDGITDTQLNDWLWFDVEEQHPEWFNDDWDEMQDTINRIDEMRASGKPWFESNDGAEVFLSYVTDEDDARVFKLTAEMVGGNAGLYVQAEVDYDFSKDLEDNMSELKTKLMVEDQVYEKLPKGMEYVESFPCWAITIFANSDYSGFEDKEEDIYEANLWAAENGYGTLAEAYEETHNDFDSHPAFGLACDTELVVMNKVDCQIWLVYDSKRDTYLQAECYELVSFETEEAAKKWIEDQPNKEDLSPEKVYDPEEKPE